MRILVVGNLGYVGPVVCRYLRAQHPRAELYGFDAGFFAHCLTSHAPWPELSLTAQYFGDARAFPANTLKGMDAVVHLAALSNDPMGNRYESATDRINRGSVLEVARMAREAGARSFTFASSCSVYGYSADRPRQETDPLDPLTAYARSKIAAENGLREIAGGDMQVTCLRFATACGMSPRLRLDLVLNDFVAGALTHGEIDILSDGTPWRPLIHVDDMARAIDWAIGRPARQGNFLTVNAGSAEWNFQVSELAAAVAAQLPGTKITVNASAPPDRRSYKVDFSRFEELAAGYLPQTGLADAISGLIEGLRDLGFADKQFRQGRLMRLNVLDSLVRSGRLSSDIAWTSA